MNGLIVFQSWVAGQEKGEKMSSWFTKVEILVRTFCRIDNEYKRLVTRYLGKVCRKTN